MPAEDPSKSEVLLQGSQQELTNPYLNFYEVSEGNSEPNRDVEQIFLSLVTLGPSKYVYEDQESAHDS